MWFASDQGVSRYDGDEFVNYTIDEGLPDNEVFKLFEDSHHRIWFLTYNGKPCFYLNDTIHTTENTPYLTGFTNNVFFTEMLEDSTHTLWFFKEYSSEYFSFNNHIVKKHFLPNNTHFLSSINYNRKSYIIYNSKNKSNVWSYCLTTPNESEKIISTFESPSQLSKFIYHNNRVYYIDKGEFNFASAKISYCKELSFNQSFTLPLNKDISFTLCSETGIVSNKLCWSTNNGFITLSENALTFQNNLQNYIVTSVKEDFEKGLWCSTKGNGVYYFPNKRSVFHKNITSPISLIKQNPSNLNELVFCSNGEFIIQNNHNISKYTLPEEVSKTEIITDIEFLPNNQMLIGNGMGLYIKNNNHIQKLKSKSGIKQILIDNDSIIYATATGLIKQHLNQIKTPYNDNTPPFRVLSANRSLSVVKISKQTYLVGNNLGVYVSNPNNISKITDSINHRIKKIVKSTSGILALCSDVKGIYLIDQHHLKHYNIKHGLISNHVNNARFDSKENLWVATLKGLSYINLKNNQITNYSTLNGVIDENINDVFPLNDSCILLATSSGLYNYNPLLNYDVTSPRIYVRNIKINAKPVSTAELSNLSYKENNIEIKLSGLSYNNQLDFFYKLNNDNEWVKINGRLLTFVNMPPGQYELKIKCQNLYKKWSNETVINIMIHPPFHKTWWFISLVGCTIIILIISVFIYYQKRKIKEREIKLILSETKQKALRAQLNPHFVFNALNSIQYLYLSHKEDEALEYLNKFSVLLRNTLNHSDKTHVSIQEEIDNIQLYLQIEQIRSSKIFNFEFIIDEKINTYNLLIPSMLIQPYVENSVWHGFKNIDKVGIITLEVKTTDDDAIKIIIKDNGSGFDTNKEADTKSKGTKLINERIKALNSINKRKIMQHIVSNSNGTIVEFIFPKQY